MKQNKAKAKLSIFFVCVKCPIFCAVLPMLTFLCRKSNPKTQLYQDKLIVFVVSYLYAYEYVVLFEDLPMQDFKRAQIFFLF